jgi:hypothetical protein
MDHRLPVRLQAWHCPSTPMQESPPPLQPRQGAPRRLHAHSPPLGRHPWNRLRPPLPSRHVHLDLDCRAHDEVHASAAMHARETEPCVRASTAFVMRLSYQ